MRLTTKVISPGKAKVKAPSGGATQNLIKESLVYLGGVAGITTREFRGASQGKQYHVKAKRYLTRESLPRISPSKLAL